MKYQYKKQLTKIKRIIQNPGNIKYLSKNKKINQSGILLVIHESQELGASILALHIAEELVKNGIGVYIVSRQFGVMNDKYSCVAPTQIALTRGSYERICKFLYGKGFRKALMITASTGDLVRITKKCGFNVVSMIHELGQVVRMLHLEDATKEMLEFSDKVLFSTSIAKEQILNVCGVGDNDKILIKPQGTYFNKPSTQEIEEQKCLLKEKYPALESKKVVTGIGNTTERKGFDIFLRTANLLPQYNFVWAGKKEKYYEEAIEKYGKPSNFVYLGALNSTQLSGLYAIADVYLMCSRFDTLPSTIFEALLFSTPVIGAKCSGGIIDIINNKNGILTDEADCNQFAKAIDEIMLKTDIKIKEHSNSFEEYVKYVIGIFD